MESKDCKYRSTMESTKLANLAKVDNFISPHREELHPSNSVTAMAEKTNAPSQECFKALGNGQIPTHASELNSHLSSQMETLQGHELISPHLSNAHLEVTALPSESPEVEKLDHLQDTFDTENSEIDGESSSSLSLDDIMGMLDDAEELENEGFEEIKNSTEFRDENLAIEEKAQTAVEEGRQEKSDAISEKAAALEIMEAQVKIMESQTKIMDSQGQIMETQATIMDAQVQIMESHMDEIAHFREMLKDTVTINVGNAGSADDIIRALETGQYQNITESRDEDPANRIRFNWSDHELVVPVGSPLLTRDSVTIQGHVFTIRAETDEERVEFNKNWEGFKVAQSRSLEVKEDNKTEKDEEARTKEAPGAAHSSKGDHQISNREQEELSAKLQQQVAEAAKRDSLQLMKHAQEGYANTETRRRAETIKKEDLEKEIDKKLVDKQDLNFGLVKEINLKSSLPATTSTIVDHSRANNYSAKIVLLKDHRRKVA